MNKKEAFIFVESALDHTFLCRQFELASGEYVKLDHILEIRVERDRVILSGY